jgi:serine/threonine-protein kinase
MSNEQTAIWKQAIEIYQHISELSIPEAIKHVDSIHNLSYEIRQAVITLVNSGNQASQYIEKNFSPQLLQQSEQPLKYKSGDSLSEYQLIEELGRGGMSYVFKAKRLDVEQQKFVAIKIFSPKNYSPQLLEHFIAEQSILSELSHSNIVDMLHGGKTEDGTTYLVMELIAEALPINQFCKNKKSSVSQKIAYILQCAKALVYSHANLIIHRDLKPDNILIDKQGRLKLVDFGIAKLINKDISGNKTTIMALTPSYAAPEQINAEKISIKTDIFSLAVVAVELLIGEKFLPDDRLIKSCEKDEQAIETTLKILKIDKDLKNILHQALAQAPNDRYASMQSFADDLDNYLNDLPVAATSQSPFYRLGKFAKRRKALFLTSFTLLLSLILGLGITLWQNQQIKLEAAKARNVKQFMLDTFTQTNPDISKGIEVSAKDLLRVYAQKLDAEAHIDAQIKFELLQTLGIAYGALGDPTRAVDLLKKSLQINPNDSHSQSYLAMYLLDATDSSSLQKYLDGINTETMVSHLDQARILQVRAKVHARESEFDQALLAMNKAIKLIQLDKNPVAEISATRTLAEIYYRQSHLPESIEILEKALKNTNEKTPLTAVISLSNDLAKIYNDTGEYQQAKNIFEQSLVRIRSILGNENPELSKTLIEIAFVYKRLGMIEKANKAANEAYQINLNLYGENSIQFAHAVNLLATMAYQDGDTDKAIDLFYQALKIFEQQQTEDYTDTLKVKVNLGLNLSFVNRNEEALKVLSEAYEKQKEKLGLKHDSTIHTQQVLARVMVKTGQIDEAIELAELSMQNANKYLDKNHPEVVGSFYTLAMIYKNNNQYQKALELVLRIKNENLLATSEPNYPILLRLIAQLYVATDKLELADTYYRDSLTRMIQLYSAKHVRTLIIQLEYAKFLLQYGQGQKSNDLLAQVKKFVTEEEINNPKLNKLLADLQ